MKVGDFDFNLRELAGCLAFNMAAGFAVGLALHYLLFRGSEGVPHAH